ncbi:MAG: tetratricopeptide repeat protein [Ignavibacteriae bacterium]|nr:tetratricopeptide repeat protein [Ignavibacteriota bacterium]
MKKYRYTNNAEDYYKNGLEKYEIKDFAGALSDFSITIEMNPDMAEAYYSRGLLYGKEYHKYTRAIKDFTKAIKLKPGYAKAYYDRGVTYRILDDIKNSCTDWKKAKELGFKEADVLIEKYCKKFNQE